MATNVLKDRSGSKRAQVQREWLEKAGLLAEVEGFTKVTRGPIRRARLWAEIDEVAAAEDVNALPIVMTLDLGFQDGSFSRALFGLKFDLTKKQFVLDEFDTENE